MKRASLLTRRRGLLPQLFTVAILPLSLLLVIVAFGGLAMHQQEMRMLAGERDVRTVQAIANTLNQLLRQRLQTVGRLGREMAAAGSQTAALETLCREDPSGQVFDLGLAYYSLETRRFSACTHPTFWEGLSPQTAAALAERIEEQRFSGLPGAAWMGALDGGPHDGVAGQPAIFVLAALQSGAVVGAITPASVITPAMENLQTHTGHLEALVIDSQMRQLHAIGNPAEGEALEAHPGVRESLDGETGFTYLESGESEHVVAYSPVAPLGWGLLIEEPWQMVASPMLRTTENTPLVLIPALGLALVALWYAARYIVRPLGRLEEQAARLGWGDYQAIEAPVGGIAEIQSLQTALVHLAHQVRAAQQGLRDYIGAMTRGQEDERLRLARELHDDTLQSLIALNQRTQLVQLKLQESPPEEAAAALAELQTLVEGSIQDLRRTTRALRPIYLEELGLAAALEMLARETSQVSGMPVSYRSGGEMPFSRPVQRLPAEVELALYRIAQEGLNNAVRHARAGEASLRLAASLETGAVLLEIEDDGQGFTVPQSPAAFAPSGHFGLLGMHERAEMIGARLEIWSKPGVGTRVTVLLPRTDQ